MTNVSFGILSTYLKIREFEWYADSTEMSFNNSVVIRSIHLKLIYDLKKNGGIECMKWKWYRIYWTLPVMYTWKHSKMSTPVSNRKYGAQKIRLTSKYTCFKTTLLVSSFVIASNYFASKDHIPCNNITCTKCFLSSSVREEFGPERSFQ